MIIHTGDSSNDLIISGKNLFLGRTVSGYNVEISYNNKTGETKIYGTASESGRIVVDTSKQNLVDVLKQQMPSQLKKNVT